MFSVLTNSNKLSLGQGFGGGWTSDKGLNNIKKENVGAFTKRVVKVGDTQDAYLQAQERVKDLGDDFGSAISKFSRGVDAQRIGSVDYGGSASSLGPLGKPLMYRNDNVLTGIRGVGEAESRQSVYNISQGNTLLNLEKEASIEQTRIIKGANQGSTVSEILNVSVEPTKVYMAKQTATSFGTGVNGMVNDRMINIPGVSERKTKQDFNYFKNNGDHNLISGIKVKNIVSGKKTQAEFDIRKNTGEITLDEGIIKMTNVPSEKRTKNDFQHFKNNGVMELDSKLKILDLQSTQSDSKKYVPHQYNEESVHLQNKHLRTEFVPQQLVEKDNSIKVVESYKFKHEKPSLNEFQAKAHGYLKF